MMVRLMVVFLGSAMAVLAKAQPAPPAPPEAEAVIQLQGAEAELEAARAELEAAAREVARLSAEIVGPEVEEVIRRIRIGGRRAMLGVSVDEADGGVVVAAVTPGGPADEAGIKSGDVITRINGIDVSGDDGVRRLVDEMRNVEPGDEVPLVLQHDDQERSVAVTASEFSARRYVFAYGEDDEDNAARRGRAFEFSMGGPGWPRMLRMGHWAEMELVELTPGLGSYFGTEEGLLVVRSPADSALQLQDGDVILQIGTRKPRDTGHAMRILRSFEKGETLTLEIMRNQRPRTLKIEIPDTEKLSSRH